jgi:hypothetical protein
MRVFEIDLSGAIPGRNAGSLFIAHPESIAGLLSQSPSGVHWFSDKLSIFARMGGAG